MSTYFRVILLKRLRSTINGESGKSLQTPQGFGKSFVTVTLLANIMISKCVCIPFVQESQWPSACNTPCQSLLLNYRSCPESWQSRPDLKPGTVRSPRRLHPVSEAWGPAVQTRWSSQQISLKVFWTLHETSRRKEKVAGDRRAASRQTSPWHTLSFASECRTLSLIVPFWLLVMGIIFGSREYVNQTDAAGK